MCVCVSFMGEGLFFPTMNFIFDLHLQNWWLIYYIVLYFILTSHIFQLPSSHSCHYQRLFKWFIIIKMIVTRDYWGTDRRLTTWRTTWVVLWTDRQKSFILYFLHYLIRLKKWSAYLFSSVYGIRLVSYTCFYCIRLHKVRLTKILLSPLYCSKPLRLSSVETQKTFACDVCNLHASFLIVTEL